ncbi:MAG TPA: cation:dicarboxylase symporter family transporter [Clostridiales bacterium]|nr:cation:dicarboxylase symporter family transporter [Clostridiales bacterium]
MNLLYPIIALIVFCGLLALLVYLQKSNKSFTVRVLAALGMGLVFGSALQAIFGADSSVTTEVTKWTGIVGSGFTKSLQFIIVPLILVSIISAITKIQTGAKAFKTSGKIIAILLITTAVSALIGFLAVQIFGLDASELVKSISGAEQSEPRKPTDIPTSILNIIPSNIFSALTANSALPIVFIGVIIGFAILAIKDQNLDLGQKFLSFVEGANELVMTITDFVIEFTPYGVLALITKVTAVNKPETIINLIMFVVASFAALITMFIIHLIILRLSGVNIVKYLKKVSPALIFAFTSRSSAATLPLTIKVQTDNLGVSKGHANLAGAFGTTIGQNGCAGVHPAMVVTLVAAALGWKVWDPGFIVLLLIYVTISSIGIAGVGGGATNASILVLSMFGLPIDLVAILASVEFLIDMGRTALNVHDAILAGVISSKLDNEFNNDIFNDKVKVEELKA